eukprot:6834527-Heterocapsa_arctica.AAC.1
MNSTLKDKVVDGNTLRQELTGIVLARRKGSRLGSHMCAVMVRKYSDDVELLRVNNTETTVVAELVSALSMIHAN